MQIDFGDTKVWIGGEAVRVHLFVATLGYSRRMHVQASARERQADWFAGMEGAFLRFGGVASEILFDNARALVDHHDARTREVRFNARLHAFAGYWGFTPRACAPYRARTKGKDERGVGYVKRNAVAGRRFANWAEFTAHLERWSREIADRRIHGTTGEQPILRFKDEAPALRPLGGRAPFDQLRDLVRKVRSDCVIDLDTNSSSVPWRLVGGSGCGSGRAREGAPRRKADRGSSPMRRPLRAGSGARALRRSDQRAEPGASGRPSAKPAAPSGRGLKP